MKYVIGGGVASVFIVYAILMVLGSIGGSGAIELLALLLLMALPGMIAGAFYAGREKQEKEHAELKRELAISGPCWSGGTSRRISARRNRQTIPQDKNAQES